MLKTTNYEVKHNGVVIETLPEAYAIIRRLVVGNNDMACAYIGVYRTRELARNYRSVPPITEERIDFKSVRGNDFETAYNVAKTKEIEKRINPTTRQLEEYVVKDRFFGWEDDYSI